MRAAPSRCRQAATKVVISAYGCWSVISVAPAASGTGTVRQEPPPGGKYRPWALARRRQGDAAALADPGDDQAVRVHQRVSARNLQHQERIGIDPAVVKVSRPAIPAVRKTRRMNPPASAETSSVALPPPLCQPWPGCPC